MKLFSPARIHLGFLELDQTLPRFFGSMGLTVSNFCFEVQISKSKNLNVVTEHENLKKKTLDIFYKFKKKYDVNFCNIKIKKIIPSHIGLGSGKGIGLSSANTGGGNNWGGQSGLIEDTGRASNTSVYNYRVYIKNGSQGAIDYIAEGNTTNSIIVEEISV